MNFTIFVLVSVFLGNASVLISFLAARKHGLPPQVALVGLLATSFVLAMLVWKDDGSIGLLGYATVLFTLLLGLGGALQLFIALKKGKTTAAVGLLDERR